MGEDKLLMEYHGKLILQHSIDLLIELPVYERILVTTDTRTKLLTIPQDIRLIINPHPENGLSSSINIGVNEATGTHYLFLTADQPRLKLANIRPLITAPNNYPDKIIYPLVNSNPCSPTLFPSRFRNELLNLFDPSLSNQNDHGGRIIRDKNKQHCLAIKAENPENFTDIDNIDDYKNLNKEWI